VVYAVLFKAIVRWYLCGAF